MFCPKCGTQLEDGARFCPTCGRQVNGAPAAQPEPVSAPQPEQAAPAEPIPQAERPDLSAAGGPSEAAGAAPSAPVQPPQPPVPPAAPASPAPSGGGKKGGALRIVAALVVVAILAVGVFGFVLPALRNANADPKTTLTNSLSATSQQMEAARAQMLADLGLDGVMGASHDGPIQQTFGITLGDLPYDAAILSGAGVTLRSQFDPDQRINAGDLSIQYGSMDLAQLQYYATPEMGAISCPTLLDDNFYGISWDVLLDLAGDAPETQAAMDTLISLLSTDYTSYSAGLNQDTMDRLDAALDTLFAASTVTSDGSQSVTTLSGTENLEQYTVQLPGSAIAAYLSSAFEAIMEDPMIAPIMDLALEEEGMTREEFYAEFDTVGQMFQDTITLTAYIRSGYLAVVSGTIPMTYEGDTASVDFLYQLGTQESILGGTMLEVTIYDDTGYEMTIRFSSQGQRGTGSVYEDTSRLSFLENGSELFYFSFSTYYDAQQSADNFSFQMDVGESGYSLFTVSADGSVTADSAAQSLTADLTTALLVEGDSISMDLLYAIEPLDQITIDGTDYIAVDQMTAEDVSRLESLAEQNLYLLVMQLYYGM